MDRDGWSGKFHLCSKEAIAISDLTLIVYNNITKIKYNTIEERRNGTKGGSGRVTTPGRLPIWAFSRPIYMPESRDGLQRHDHVMLPKGVLITVETPVSKRVSLNHPYRFNTITYRRFIFTGSWSATQVLLSFVGSELPRGLGAYVSPYLYSAINVQCSYEKTK